MSYVTSPLDVSSSDTSFANNYVPHTACGLDIDWTARCCQCPVICGIMRTDRLDPYQPITLSACLLFPLRCFSWRGIDGRVGGGAHAVLRSAAHVQ